MGSRKTYFSHAFKLAAALASVLSVVGGITVAAASAQTARFEPLYQEFPPQVPGQNSTFATGQMPAQGNVARLASNPYSATQVQNSARILRSQPAFLPPARQRATVNRRALVGQGRMIAAGFRQEPGVLGSLPGAPGPTVLKKQDDPKDGPQNFFGDNQAVPTIPRNNPPQGPRPNTQQPEGLPEGELPPDIFKNPFDKERRTQPSGSTIDVPGDLTPEDPNERPDPPKNDEEAEEPSENSGPQQRPNPFVPLESERKDNEIDYQTGRGFDTTRNLSNVYRPPAPEGSSVLGSGQQPNNGVYYVPAYDPIPGTQQSTLAPPTVMSPDCHHGQQPAWPGQYAQQQPLYFQQPQYQQPQYQQPPYQQPPYQQPPYQQPPYQQRQYQQPPYQQPAYQPPAYLQPHYQQPPTQYAPPQQYAHPQQYAPAPGLAPQQPVYSSVVEPLTDTDLANKGPMAPVRRGLLGKIQRDLKKDWGFGDYQSCQNSGSCSSGCDSVGCSASNATCPVFYIGFQGAWNDAFNVANGQGSELQLDDGTAFYFSLGRMNGRNLRTEIELSFRDNDISSLLTPNAELPYTGQLQTFSGMGNLYWEFIKFPTGRLKPYIGAGVGFISVSSDLRLPSDPSTTNSQTSSSSSFAYQWMAGVNYKVSNHLDLYGEYRFVDADSFGISSDRDELSGNFGYSANSIGGGLRWKF